MCCERNDMTHTITTNALPSIIKEWLVTAYKYVYVTNMLPLQILGPCSKYSQKPCERLLMLTNTNVGRSPCDHCDLFANEIIC